MEISGDGESTPYNKPCLNCRKRKVKCDKKSRPCSNCSRSKLLCTYDSFDPGVGTASSGQSSHVLLAAEDDDIRERLARLEALMATVLVRDNATVSQSHPVGPDKRLNERAGVSSSSAFPSHIIESNISPSDGFDASAPVGQIVFQEGHSAYFDTDFHIGLMDEVRQDLQVSS